MNEWTELDINNVPSDMWVDGAWEAEWLSGGKWHHLPFGLKYSNPQLYEQFAHRIRRPELKAPTHEEIMTKWWNVGTWERVDRFKWWNVGAWERVDRFNTRKGKCQYRLTDSGVQSAEFFINRESADIPPVA